MYDEYIEKTKSNIILTISRYKIDRTLIGFMIAQKRYRSLECVFIHFLLLAPGSLMFVCYFDFLFSFPGVYDNGINYHSRASAFYTRVCVS
jgi:hypothetical protein